MNANERQYISWSAWFDEQLQSTLRGFIWAVRQLPAERLYTHPPVQLGEWTAAEHVAHLLEYEEKLALPSMHQWMGASAVIREAKVAQDIPPIEEMLYRFEQVRRAEIDLLPRFSTQDWQATRATTFWGEVSLFWLVSKTYQHTLEHTHDILRLSLFWDRILARMSGA